MSDRMVNFFCLFIGVLAVFIALSVPCMVWENFHQYDVVLGKAEAIPPWFVRYAPVQLVGDWIMSFEGR